MEKQQEKTSTQKPNLHPRNLDNSGYHFGQLIDCCSELRPFVFTNVHGIQTIDFANPEAWKDPSIARQNLDQLQAVDLRRDVRARRCINEVHRIPALWSHLIRLDLVVLERQSQPAGARASVGCAS
mgnify:CR=1 FL=1